MKIFVTGASSFLGKDLVKKLAHTHEVLALSYKTPIEDPKITVISGGLEDIEFWKARLSGCNVVIHLAGITHARDTRLYEKINTEGTRALVDACKECGITQFIYASTRAIGKKCGAYGESKEKAEETIKASGVSYTIFRIAEAYDDDWSKVEGLGDLAQLVEKSPIVPYMAGFGMRVPTLAPIHKDDVVEAFVRALGNPKTFRHTYTLAGPENLTPKEIVKRMTHHRGLTRLFIPTPIIFLPLGFFLINTLLHKGVPDQLARFMGEKDPLSPNVETDLGITPRLFLK